MKKLVALVLAVSIFTVGCGQSKMIDGVERKPVGIISMVAPKNLVNGYSKDIQYEPCWGNIIWGAILCETIVAPIYFYGFSMFNPVSKISTDSTKAN